MHPRYRTIVGMECHENLHYTTLNNYFLTLPVGQLEELFKTLVRELNAKKVIKGKYLAMDSTHIFAWAASSNPMYRDQFPVSNSYTESSVLHLARHGYHTTNFFGYKCHLLIDCQSELPVAVAITSGNDADSTQIVPLIRKDQGQNDRRYESPEKRVVEEHEDNGCGSVQEIWS